MQDREPPGDAELLLNLDLSSVILELAERADLGQCISTDFLQIDQLLVRYIERECQVVSTDTATGTAALHLVAVLDRLGSECGNEFFDPHRVLGVPEMPLFCGLQEVTTVVDGDLRTGQGARDAVGEFLEAYDLRVVVELGEVPDVDGPLELHIDLCKHLVDPVAEFVVVLQFFVDLVDRLVAPVADESNIHTHLLGKHDVACRHRVPDV